MIMPVLAQFMRLLASVSRLCASVSRLCASARVCLASVCVCSRLCASVCICSRLCASARVCLASVSRLCASVCVCSRQRFRMLASVRVFASVRVIRVIRVIQVIQVIQVIRVRGTGSFHTSAYECSRRSSYLANACVCLASVSRLCASASVCVCSHLCASVSRRSSCLASVCVCLRELAHFMRLASFKEFKGGGNWLRFLLSVSRHTIPLLYFVNAHTRFIFLILI